MPVGTRSVAVAGSLASRPPTGTRGGGQRPGCPRRRRCAGPLRRAAPRRPTGCARGGAHSAGACRDALMLVRRATTPYPWGPPQPSRHRSLPPAEPDFSGAGTCATTASTGDQVMPGMCCSGANGGAARCHTAAGLRDLGMRRGVLGRAGVHRDPAKRGDVAVLDHHRPAQPVPVRRHLGGVDARLEHRGGAGFQQRPHPVVGSSSQPSAAAGSRTICSRESGASSSGRPRRCRSSGCRRTPGLRRRAVPGCAAPSPRQSRSGHTGTRPGPDRSGWRPAAARARAGRNRARSSDIGLLPSHTQS